MKKIMAGFVGLVCLSGLSSSHAAVWLNENFNSMTNGQIPVVGGQIFFANAPTGAIAAVSNSGNIVLRINKPSTTNASAQFAYTLSDTNFSMPRQQGYITFKIQQVNPNSVGTNNNYLQFRIGANDTNTMNSGANGFVDLRFYNNAATKNFQILSPGSSSTTATTNTIGQVDVVTIKLWYNNLVSSMSFTNPSGSVVTMNGNSVMVYANNTLMNTNTAWANGQPMVSSVTSGTGTSSSIGKLGFFVTGGNGADFYIDDLYAADTAPAAATAPTITSSNTATAFVGRAFSYAIQASESPTSYTCTTLPTGLTFDTASGVISGTPDVTAVTSTVTLTAVNSAGASANFALTITVNPAFSATWINTGTLWSSASSWTNNAVPANSDTVVFASVGPNNNTVDVGTGKNVLGLLFDVGANAYTFTGTDLSLGNNGITNSSTAIQTFNNKVFSSSNATWNTITGGGLVFNSGVDTTTSGSSSSRTLKLAGGGNFTFNGPIGNGGTSTNGSVDVSSTGLTLFSASNTYTGTTTIGNGATMRLGNAGALGATTNGTTVSSGGVLDLNGQSVTGESLSLSGATNINGALFNSSASAAVWSGPITLSNSSASIGGTNGDITISGSISGGYALIKYGTNKLILSASNSIPGLTLRGGAVELVASNSGTGVISMQSNKPVVKIVNSNGLDSGAILLGPSSVADMGTLDLAAGAASYTLNSYGSPTTNGNNMTFTNSGGVSANLIFTNGTNYVTVSSGGSGGKGLYNNSTNLDVVFNGAVDIGSSADNSITFTGVGNFKIKGTVFNNGTGYRGVSKNGKGTLTLFTNNTYNGPTLVQDGTLEVSHSDAIPSATVSNTLTVQSGSKLKANTNLTVGPMTVGGTLQMALGTTITSLGAVDLSGATISLTGTASADSYTLVAGSSAAATNAPTLSSPITGYSLVLTSTSLKLQKDSVGSGFDAWTSSYNLSGADALRDADPDKDGMNNQDEYAFGTSPTSAGSRTLTAVDTGTTDQVTLKWLQRSDVTYTVKSTTDLSAGFTYTETGAIDSSPQPSGLPSGYIQRQITVNTSGTRKFVRVQAAVP